MNRSPDRFVHPAEPVGYPRLGPGGQSRWRTAVLALTLVLLIGLGVGLERYVLVDTAFGGQAHPSLADVEEFETLSAVYDLIREQYVLSDETSDEVLIHGAAAGMLEALDDAGNSYVMTPAEIRSLEDDLASGFVGIGVRLDVTVSPPRVVYPMAGSPALEAGILPADEILAIDDVPYHLLPTSEAFVDLLLGEADTDVTLVLRHHGATDTYNVTITRQLLEVNTVSWAMLPGDILWLHLDEFTEDAADRVEAALEAGNDLGARGVILDLRSNLGGSLLVDAVAVASQFQPRGAVVFQNMTKDGEVIPVETRGRSGAWRDGPLVVLVDEDTAGTAELLASALKHNDRAILVGETTYGIGTSVTYYDLPGGSSIQLSVGLWLTPDGDSMLNTGVTPHVEVLGPSTAGFAPPLMFDDNALTAVTLAATGDIQLLTGYGIVLDLVEGSD